MYWDKTRCYIYLWDRSVLPVFEMWYWYHSSICWRWMVDSSLSHQPSFLNHAISQLTTHICLITWHFSASQFLFLHSMKHALMHYGTKCKPNYTLPLFSLLWPFLMSKGMKWRCELLFPPSLSLSLFSPSLFMSF